MPFENDLIALEQNSDLKKLKTISRKTIAQQINLLVSI